MRGVRQLPHSYGPAAASRLKSLETPPTEVRLLWQGIMGRGGWFAAFRLKRVQGWSLTGYDTQKNSAAHPHYPTTRVNRLALRIANARAV